MSDTPCDVWFYHLERSGLDQVLPELLEKTLARGWKALVRSKERARVDHLDGWLWSYRDESFLAHGTDDEPMAERQPILITAAADSRGGAPNGAHVLFLIDGAEAGDISPYQRCILLFDGRDAEALADARRRWSAFKAAGHPVSYWRQGETSGWRQEA
jgi:DNA polymerase-3 subunit chi